MFPGSSCFDEADGAGADVEPFGDGCVGIWRGADSEDFFGDQFGGGVSCPDRLVGATFGFFVSHVFGMGPEEEVMGCHATGTVTFVQNMHTFGDSPEL